MKIFKDKDGNKLTFKEFFSRWKKGIETVNVYQQTSIQLQATLIMCAGLLCGIIISLFAFRSMWWLTIILIGGLVNTSIQLLGTYQKRQALKPFFDTAVKEIQETKIDEIKQIPNLDEYGDEIKIIDGEQKGMSSQAIKIEDVIKEIDKEEIIESKIEEVKELDKEEIK